MRSGVPRIEPGGAAKGGKRSRQPTHLGQRHAALATTPGGGASIGGDAIPGIGSRARQDRRGGQCRLPAQVRLGAVAQEAYFGQRTQAGAVLARTGRRPWERDRGLPLCRFRASRSGSAALLEFATAAAGAGIIAPWPSRRRGGPWATAQGVAPDGAEDRRTPRSARRLLARSTGIGWAMSPGPHGDWASDDAGIEVQARGIWTQRRPSNQRGPRAGASTGSGEPPHPSRARAPGLPDLARRLRPCARGHIVAGGALKRNGTSPPAVPTGPAAVRPALSRGGGGGSRRTQRVPSRAPPASPAPAPASTDRTNGHCNRTENNVFRPREVL